MFRSIYYPSEGQALINLSPVEIKQKMVDKKGLLWVSLEHPAEDELLLILRDTFQFHPLAIEDCQSSGYQTPKVDDFDDYLFIVAHALQGGPHLDRLETIELNCFLGETFLVTSSLAPEMQPVDKIWERLTVDERLVRRGPDFICHAILDALVDEYLPFLDDMEAEIDEFEDSVLTDPQPETLQRILALKHNMLALRRVISPQREVMNRLSRDDFPQIKAQHQIYFRDVYDHLVRIQDLSETIRDIVSSALDTYLSSTSNRLNEVMRALTVVSTIFLPLTFLAGVYGMNFKYMPELDWPAAYPLVWLSFGLIAGGMIWFFKKRGWF
ncbi:MAG: magnesium/cobalt transporter CorA [Anaerolineae bacterium]|nr:magnesium/cobalt transporter CorA [Anaerolineae bacterium]